MPLGVEVYFTRRWDFIYQWNESGTKEVGIIVNKAAKIDKYWRGRKDSNPQPSDPKSDALSS